MAQAKLRKHKLKAGDKIGHFTVIQRLRDNTKTQSPNLKVQFLVECSCGTRLTIPHYYLIRKEPKTHCGCKVKTIKTIYNREYRCWMMMHQRCENPNHVAYKHYHGRGIGIDPLYHKDREDGKGFENWLGEIGPAPSLKHSVDRRNNTLGYIPGNLRWATSEQQRANQGETFEGRPLAEIEAEQLNAQTAAEEDS